MNRERQLAGVNSYERELGLRPLDILRGAVSANGTAAWLDLCCGTGRALIQAAAQLREEGLASRTALVGVDLVDAFDSRPAALTSLELVAAPIGGWTPDRSFDLITCVHGLHYVGDKLAAISRAASWLTPAGRLVADLDLAAVIVPQAARQLARTLREAGFSYDSRRHRVSRVGLLEARLPFRYLGADDQAGPGYTGQPAVVSHYAVVPEELLPFPDPGAATVSFRIVSPFTDMDGFSRAPSLPVRWVSDARLPCLPDRWRRDRPGRHAPHSLAGDLRGQQAPRHCPWRQRDSAGPYSGGPGLLGRHLGGQPDGGYRQQAGGAGIP